jgi:hypothetical protein
MVKVKIIFFSWDTFYGKLIKWHTGSKWTHIGMVAEERENGDLIVFEAVNKGLVKSVYDKAWLGRLEAEGIIMIKTVNVPNSEALYDICEKYEGTPYDWVSIINIGWYAIFGKVALNFSGPKALICSEFVSRVLYDISASKIDFQKEYNKSFDLVTPADILRSEYVN